MTNGEFLARLEARINEAKHENWKVSLTTNELNMLYRLRNYSPYSLRTNPSKIAKFKRRRYVAKVRRMIEEARIGLAYILTENLLA